jgi:nucleotide-binding universal stress UspA family protein
MCPRPIVLGLSPTPFGAWGEEDPCARVIEFALRRAEELRVQLHVVSVLPVEESTWRTSKGQSNALAQFAREAENRLKWWTKRFPGVDIQQRNAFAAAVPALLEAAQGSQLVVLGRGTRFVIPHMLLGQTARSMIRRSRIPVAVVPAASLSDQVLGS